MAPEGSTVFVVDDDAGLRASIKGLLKSVGLHSECFGTTRGADGPSCLVLDVRLPDESGLDFQRKLTEAGIEILTIFITGYTSVRKGRGCRKSMTENSLLP